MSPELFSDIALLPALRLLPARMNTPEAQAMLIAIALQESGLKHREQIAGPARGYLMFERSGGVHGVLHHPVSRAHAMNLCTRLDIVPEELAVYVAITYNDILAAGFARLLLWTSLRPLPKQYEQDDGWELYIDCWRPGKPHPQTWAEHWQHAWRVIADEPV